MVKRNPHFLNLSERYLFPEVARRVQCFKQTHPEVELISLSVGDTSEPLTPAATEGLKRQAEAMETREGYIGYGPEQGNFSLREKISKIFYNKELAPDEIFVSDGAKCDLGRLQLLFGQGINIGVQDPTYPVYVDTSLIIGSREIIYLPCHAENDFFPDFLNLPPIDLVFLCSPNNPTGVAATHAQLRKAVSWAHKHHSILIFDAAYSGFIQDPRLPRSIYAIEGADEVAIEISSFSKWAGFTGVRLGWTVIPKKLRFDEGEPLHTDFNRLITTFFNGASVIAQAGGLAALSHEGLIEMEQTLSFYLQNAQLIRNALEYKGLTVHGGMNAPYIWVKCGHQPSWELFQKIMESTGIVTTPGSGFGKQGEGYLRFSAFGSRSHILKACKKITTSWPENL
jgi:LL-diaminopimelate aminotransferase